MDNASTVSPSDRRPSPKALLELAAKEQRGKLKVFLGAAPGVGKTYAMLAMARAKRAEGTDVVVGVVETHGREETASLLEGLEVLPRKPVAYRKHTLMDFDVEAAIARRPALLLVDEFAHTNAPDQLHTKRYQDVEEVLRAGIDVWTTLNIQHLESLTDVVQQITGVTVRETVPDRVLDEADEVVIVDLTPEELIGRLKEGKVYLPDNARRAIDQFFKPGNLTALRELALRRTTDRVDEQMLAHLRQQGIEGAWPTAERLLVCTGDDEQSEKVVRAAARMAVALKSDWMAVHVSANDRELTDRAAMRRVNKALRLAERLGATTARLSGSNLVDEILRYAKRNNITQIVIGRSAGGRVKRLMGNSLSQALVGAAQRLSVTIVAPDTAPPPRPLWTWPSPPAYAGVLGSALLAVAAAVVAGKGIEQLTSLPNLSMVFLFAVVACALRFGVWSALAAAVLSFFAFNFFFIEPRYTFTVAAPHELFALVIFLVIAMVTGSLAGRLRHQANATRDRALATQTLFDFSRKLSAAASQDDVFWLLASQSAAAIRGSSIVLAVESNELAIATGWPPEDSLDTSDWAAARWCRKERAPAGRFTTTLPTARFNYRPMIVSGDVVAIVGVEPADTDHDELPSEAEAALQSIIEQAAIAIERTRLVGIATKVETAAEGERLKSALLSSISHDLRTPLAAIVGSSSSLRTLGDRMSDAERYDLLQTIEEEGARLTSFVSNILEMTKLEAGALEIRREIVNLADIARAAATRANRLHGGRVIKLGIEGEPPKVMGDAGLLEQVVFNLLDNAHKYTPQGTPSHITVSRSGVDARIAVSDRGAGIPKPDLARVFDKFYRVNASDGRAPGTGLGLSIASALVASMGGSIVAESPGTNGQGTTITVTLPIVKESATA